MSFPPDFPGYIQNGLSMFYQIHPNHDLLRINQAKHSENLKHIWSTGENVSILIKVCISFLNISDINKYVYLLNVFIQLQNEWIISSFQYHTITKSLI